MLATMPRAFGTGRPAEMTYYETPNGARVFAAGAFTPGGDQALRWTTGKLSSISGSGSGRSGTPSAPRPRAG